MKRINQLTRYYDEKGIIVEKKERRILAKEKKEICTFIEEYIVENVKELSQKHKITSIGIAIPGTVDKTTIIKSVYLGVENYNIVENLKKVLYSSLNNILNVLYISV